MLDGLDENSLKIFLKKDPAENGVCGIWSNPAKIYATKRVELFAFSKCQTNSNKDGHNIKMKQQN